MIRKDKNEQKDKRSMIIAGVAAGVFLIGAIACLVIFNPFAKHDNNIVATDRPANSVDYGPPTDEQKKAAEAQKDEIIKRYGDGQSGESQQPSSDFTVSVSRAAQSGAGQPVNVRVLVAGVSSGTCTFTFIKDGQSIIRTGDIVYEATSSACKVDVPAGDFSQPGDWKLSVKAVSGTKQSTAIDQTVSVIK